MYEGRPDRYPELGTLLFWIRLSPAGAFARAGLCRWVGKACDGLPVPNTIVKQERIGLADFVPLCFVANA